jgi:hypothetical protein
VAGLTILTLLFLTGLFERLPQATLAAVVIAAVIELVDIAALTALWRIATRQLRGIYGIAARPDFIAAVAALAGVLVFDTLPGLVIGVVVSLLLLLYRLAVVAQAGLDHGRVERLDGLDHPWAVVTRPPMVPARRVSRPHPERVISGSPGGSGSRRTSTSSRPRAWMRSSSPYRAAWSWTGPCSTVSTGSTDARMPSKAATSESLRRPRTRIS